MMTQFDSQDRGSGRLAQWSPPPLPAHIDQPSAITPASFMAGLAELQQAMQANTLALAEFQRQQQAAALTHYQPAPAPVPYQHLSAPPQAYPQSWQGPQPWQVPLPPQPMVTTISPTIRIDASSHSSQDNSGGSWFGLLLGLGFLFALGSAALVDGGR